MFESLILDMVILLFFTYFICSVILSVLVEMGASLLNFRANELEKTLKNLFFDAGWPGYVDQHILNSPFFAALKKDDTANSKPAYLPAENFAKAILESFRTGTNPLTTTSISGSIQNNLAKLPTDLQKVVLGYIDTAGHDINTLQKQLEGFYNNSMDRAGGWYKKKIKRISFVIAILLVFALNIDTIEIIKKSIKNPKQLESAANAIQEEVTHIKTVTIDGKSKFIITDAKAFKIDTVSADSAIFRQINNQVKKIADFKAQLSNDVYSIGYNETDGFCKEWEGNDKFDWIFKIIGMLITVLALQVGSTFWFDTLNKVINLRGTGKKPEEIPKNP